MAKKEGSVAPKERINIKFVPATGDQQEEIELPLKTVILGDFTGRDDETPLEERRTIQVDKNNFASVMREMDLERVIEVKDVLSADPEAVMRLNLKFEGLKDFSPDSVVNQVPELKKLKELREALTALKGPLGNLPSFRKALGEIVDDESKREAFMAELEGAIDQSDARSSEVVEKEET